MGTNVHENESVMAIHEWVEKLVFHMTGKESKALTQLCMRILSSRIEAKSTDPLLISEKIKKKLIQQSSDKANLTKTLKFQELHGKLMQYATVTHPGALMSVLLSLMNETPTSNLNLSQDFGSVQISRPIAIPSDSFEVKAASVMLTPKPPIVQQQQPSYIDQDEISEQHLIRDVLFSFQGIESKNIGFNKKTEQYEIKASISSISLPTRYLVNKLCEMGWLYSRISAYLEKHSTDVSFGVVGQSFCYAIQTELGDYYRLIAILESQLSDENSTTQHELTLKRLFVWIQDPMERIRLLACLVDSVSGLRGGALISGVFAYSRHGDPFMSDFVRKIVTEISVPLYIMIRKWIFEGVLDDESKEFFIRADASISTDHLWRKKYTLHYEMLPTFISKELAGQIFVIGKSINFIRHCCDDTEWVMDTSVIETKLDNVDTLERVISQASSVTNAYLLMILKTKYNLLQHCHALKQYLLLGQGDFIQYLMDLLGPELSKRANQIYRHNLMSVLETALNSSNAKYEDPEILSCLDVKLHEPSSKEDGWDVFSLHYKLQAPLNTVIDDGLMAQYLQIFHFLWRLKRVEYSLSTSWCHDMNHERMIRTALPHITGALHRAYLMRNEMIHFTANLHNYMMFEVLETSYQSLLEHMDQAQDLDELIQAHVTYLARIKKNALMTDSSRSILQQLKQIFKVIISFCKLQENLYTLVLRDVQSRKKKEQEKKARTARGQWGSQGADDEEDIPSALEGVSEVMLTRLNEVSMDYSTQFEVLLQMLAAKGSENEYLRFLTFRLNFNEFYNEKNGSTDEIK